MIKKIEKKPKRKRLKMNLTKQTGKNSEKKQKAGDEEELNDKEIWKPVYKRKSKRKNIHFLVNKSVLSLKIAKSLKKVPS